MIRLTAKLLAFGSVLAVLALVTGCEQSVNTKVQPNGTVERVVEVTAPKVEVETVRRLIEPMLREKGFRYVRTPEKSIIRFVRRVNVVRNHAVFQANFSRVTPPLCPIGKYTYSETISLADYLKSDQAKLLAENTEVTYRLLMPGKLVPDGTSTQDLVQSDRLLNTYSAAIWKAKLIEPVELKAASVGRRNGVILFWLIVLAVILYPLRRVPGSLREKRRANAPARRMAKEAKARARAERDLARAESARQKEEQRRQREELRREEQHERKQREQLRREEREQRKRQTAPVVEPDPVAESADAAAAASDDLTAEPGEALPGEPSPDEAEPDQAEAAQAEAAQELEATAEETSESESADDAGDQPTAGLGYTVTSHDSVPAEEAAPVEEEEPAEKPRRGLFGRLRRKKK